MQGQRDCCFLSFRRLCQTAVAGSLELLDAKVAGSCSRGKAEMLWPGGIQPPEDAEVSACDATAALMCARDNRPPATAWAAASKRELFCAVCGGAPICGISAPSSKRRFCVVHCILLYANAFRLFKKGAFSTHRSLALRRRKGKEPLAPGCVMQTCTCHESSSTHGNSPSSNASLPGEKKPAPTETRTHMVPHP